MDYLKNQHPTQRQAWLEKEHSKMFGQWLRDEVKRELAISFESVGENLRDAYDDVDEEFSTVILPHNDNIMPRVDPLDLGKESRDDYFRADCRVLAIVAETDIIIVGSGIIKDANTADAAREAAAEVDVKYRICADLSEFPSSLSTFVSVLENVKALGRIVEYGKGGERTGTD
ncbi:hypothetical protein L6452_26177 [Arctium lappa]|uniref:Uncharacterized protein n=1 Tax=Arctium lappa TaxID=4217 RepID=A0ACB9ACU6_ARCLA|nr:hypothetical protein L6452_26177 [Arctium lappa]